MPGLDATTPAPPALFIVEWYRIDASARVVRALVPSMVLMALGAVIAVVAASGRIGVEQLLHTWHWRVPMTTTGLLVVAFSVFRAIYLLQKILAADSYITLRSDALVFHDAPTHVEIRWEELDACSYLATEGVLLLRSRDGGETQIARQFAGISGPELARRIEHVKKRALFGLPQ